MRSLLDALLLPPASLLVVAALGWCLRRRWPRGGKALVALGLGLLLLLSLPPAGNLLLESLQSEPALAPEGPLPSADAIVVLGADQRLDAPELGSDTLSVLSLERARYGALLAKRTGLPLCASGGTLGAGRLSIARMFERVLREELGVSVRWLEERSTTTAENARECAALLQPTGVRRVLLVTHAWHMPRARAAFERAGLAVVPAPTAFERLGEFQVTWLVPSARALNKSSLALHEWIGRAWYALAE